MRVLLLGGTTEAGTLANSLKNAGIETVFSYAGRTNAPVSQPVPMRVGGFGGVPGLIDYLGAETITHVIDATHPFAAQMSRNAAEACAHMGLPLTRLERPAWVPQAGDNWVEVDTLDAVPEALPPDPARVFLAIGRQHLDLFARAPQHHYLLRLIDAPDHILPLRSHEIILARGPFTLAADTALMQRHEITHVVAKNAGGSAARAKLDAARALGLPVIMVRRPDLPQTHISPDTETVLRWISQEADLGV